MIMNVHVQACVSLYYRTQRDLYSVQCCDVTIEVQMHNVNQICLVLSLIINTIVDNTGAKLTFAENLHNIYEHSCF